MPEMWIDAPRKLPYRCHATGQADVGAGPYWEGFTYCESPRDERLMTFYGSRAWLQSVLETPGSPFACITHAELKALREERDSLAGMVDALQDEINELSTVVLELETGIKPASAEDIAVAVADLLDRKAAA